jgi:hypothetical protein
MDIFNRHTERRGAPRFSDPVAAVGAAAAGLGVLFITIDVYADHPGRSAQVALFLGLVLAGYLVLLFAPRVLQPAGITAIVIGVIGALAWWWLPKADSMADIRPFIILTIVAMVVCFVVPRSRGRAVFIGIALIVLWLWALGEIANPEQAYSIAPIPSPPANTMLSLAAFNGQVSLSDLDESDPLYGFAQRCDDGDMAACDSLYFAADFGSDFREFAGDCGGRGGIPGRCVRQATPSFDFPDDSPSATFSPFTPGNFRTSDGDKSFELGLVSSLFGLAYLGGLYVLDRRKIHGLATAFVIPAAAALVEGAGLLGNAAKHAWVAGLLTMIVGVLLGAIGHVVGNRRFTTWLGGVLVGIGAVTIGLDAADFSSTGKSDNVKLVGPGLIVIGVGIALVCLAYVAAHLLRGPADDDDADDGLDPPAGPDPGAGDPEPYATAMAAPAAPAPPPSSSWPPPASPVHAPPPDDAWRPPN